MTTSIELAGGKYTVQHDHGTNLKALRHGEPWRDLTGDGLVLAMAQRIEELEAIPTNGQVALTKLRNVWNDQDLCVPQSPDVRRAWAIQIASALGGLYHALDVRGTTAAGKQQ